MFNICSNCGEYRADKTIDPAGPFAVCPVCSHRRPFRQMPLLCVGGPSAAGKSTALLTLTGRIEQAVLLEADILWRAEFNRHETHYREFFELWLRMAKNIGQSGRPAVLFSAGVAVPENIEPCVERRYFADVHYLALMCDDDVLAARLKSRPKWRGSGGEAFVHSQIEFNGWLRANAAQTTPPITLLDTTDDGPDDTARRVGEWIVSKL